MTIPANTRPLSGPAPRLTLPKGATDCHMHFYPPEYGNEPGGPAIPETATVEDYAQFQRWLGLERVVIVQSNAYQFNNEPVIQSLRQVGMDKARAIITLRPDMDMASLKALTDEGVCGARVMNLPGGATPLSALKPVERMAKELGWSLLVQFNGQETMEHLELLRSIEVPYVLDHIGKFMPPVAADDPRVDALMRLLDKGKVWFKIAGAYETSLSGAPAFADVAPIAKRVVAHAPERILWGSNFPHVGVPRAQYPNDVAMLDLMQDWIGEKHLKTVFVDNPAELYGF